MEPKEVLYTLRTKNGLSQDALAEKLFVTRQAVSRWENRDTVPNTKTLKTLSNLFDVSTLLGSPRQLVCRCCGMPLEDASLSKEPDGTFNEAYCKWCYADGQFAYTNLENLINFLVSHMANEANPPTQMCAYLETLLSTPEHWKNDKRLSSPFRILCYDSRGC